MNDFKMKDKFAIAYAVIDRGYISEDMTREEIKKLLKDIFTLKFEGNKAYFVTMKAHLIRAYRDFYEDEQVVKLSLVKKVMQSIDNVIYEVTR